MRSATQVVAVVLAMFAASDVSADDDAARARANESARIQSGESVDGGAGALIESGEQPLLRRPTASSQDIKPRANDAAGIQLPKSSMLETFWPMLVVLGAIFVCVAAVRKWLPQATRVSGGNVVNVIARQYLSGKQSLCLVKVGKRAVLVGVTPEAISTLTEISDPEELASIAASLQRGKRESFSAELSKEAFEAEDDDEISTESDARTVQGRLGETETRIRDLVGRIRAMSNGSSAAATGPANRR